MSKTHELKTVQPYFSDVIAGRKNFECRLNDRDFKKGDTLKLMEWTGREYTGNFATKKVTYIMYDDFYGLAEGYCVMGVM